jgi:hypothetical protein
LFNVVAVSSLGVDLTVEVGSESKKSDHHEETCSSCLSATFRPSSKARPIIGYLVLWFVGIQTYCIGCFILTCLQ